MTLNEHTEKIEKEFDERFFLPENLAIKEFWLPKLREIATASLEACTVEEVTRTGYRPIEKSNPEMYEDIEFNEQDAKSEGWNSALSAQKVKADEWLNPMLLILTPIIVVMLLEITLHLKP